MKNPAEDTQPSLLVFASDISNSKVIQITEENSCHWTEPKQNVAYLWLLSYKDLFLLYFSVCNL